MAVSCAAAAGRVRANPISWPGSIPRSAASFARPMKRRWTMNWVESLAVLGLGSQDLRHQKTGKTGAAP